MEEYLVPTGFGEDEFVEKKSRFLGRVWPADTEAEALAHIEEMRKQHYDATHNCWAYIIRDGAASPTTGSRAAPPECPWSRCCKKRDFITSYVL